MPGDRRLATRLGPLHDAMAVHVQQGAVPGIVTAALSAAFDD
jgi:hypothetical protein